ncbi:uncharacterized protein LOC144940586 isoform X4 [Lampetra fluviatilis]
MRPRRDDDRGEKRGGREKERAEDLSMAERVSGLSPSPRPPAILLSNSALSGSPGQSGDIGFHRILSQLKEFHNRRVEALLDKINKLKQERCLWRDVNSLIWDALTLEEVFDSNRRLKEQLKRQKETIRELQHQWQSGVTIQEEPGGHGDNEGNINNDEGNDNAEGAGSKGSMWGRDGKQPGRTAALRLNKGSPVRKRVRYRHHSLERSHDCPMATLRQQHQRRQQKEELIFVPDTLALDVPDVKRRVSGVGTATKSPLPPARGTGPSPPWGPSTPDVCTTPSPSELGDDGPPARAPETRFIFTPRCGRKPPRACGHTGLLGPLHHGSLQAATPTSPDPASAETDADSPSLLGRKLSSQEPPAPPGPFTVASIEEAQNVGTTPPDAVPDVMRDFADWKITAAESVWWRRGQRWATSDERGEQGRRASGSRVVTGTSPPLEARGAASVLTSSGAAAATPAADTDGAEMMLWRIDPSACLSQYDEDSPTAQAPRSPRFGGSASDVRDGDSGNDDNHGPEDLSVDCTFVNESVLLRHGGAIGRYNDDGGGAMVTSPRADRRPVQQAACWTPTTPSSGREGSAAGRETTYICNDSLDDLFDRTCDGEEYVSFCLNDQSTVAHPRSNDQKIIADPRSSDQETIAHSRSNDQPTNAHPRINDQLNIAHPCSNDQPTIAHPRSNDQLTIAHPRSNDQLTIAHPRSNDQPTIAHPRSNDQLTMAHPRSNDQPPIAHPHSNDQLTIAHPRSNDQPTIVHPRSNDQLTIAHPRSNDQPTIAHPRSNDQPTIAHPCSNDQLTIAHPRSNDQPPIAHPRSNDQLTIAHPHSNDQLTIAHPRSNDQPTIAHPCSNDQLTIAHPRSNDQPPIAHPRSNDQPPIAHPRSNDQLTIAHPRCNDQPTIAHPCSNDQTTIAHPRCNDQLTIAHPRSNDQLAISYPHSNDQLTIAHPRSNDQLTIAHPRCNDQPTIAHPRSNDQLAISYPYSNDQLTIAHPRSNDQLTIAHPRCNDQPTIAHPRCNDQPTIAHPRSNDQPPIAHLRSNDQLTIAHPRSNDQLTIAHPRSNDQPPIAHPRCNDQPTIAHPRCNDQPTIAHPRSNDQPPIAHPRCNDQPTIAHPRCNDQPTIAHPRCNNQLTIAHPCRNEQPTSAHPHSNDQPITGHPRCNDQPTIAHPRYPNQSTNAQACSGNQPVTTAAAHSTKRPISTATHSPDRLDTTCSKAPTQKGCGQEVGAGGRLGAEQPGFAYVDVVRNKDERRKLQGFSCKQCENFYSHLPEAERVLQMTECSRHRGRFQPPNTPENFWEVGFPSTQMCQERGYLKEEDEPANRVRRKRPYKATFSPARKQESHAWHTIARCTVHDTR